MKKVTAVFARNRYVSGATGAEQRVQMPATLLATLGSAVQIRWEVTLYAKSSDNMELRLYLAEGTKFDPRPILNDFAGKALSGSPFSFSTVGITYQDTTGSFSGLVDAMLSVKGATSAQEWADVEVRATLTYN